MEVSLYIVVKYQANERLQNFGSGRLGEGRNVRNLFQLYVPSWRHLSFEALVRRRSRPGIIVLGCKPTGLFDHPNNTLNNGMWKLPGVSK
jgi:hypothetical protein